MNAKFEERSFQTGDGLRLYYRDYPRQRGTVSEEPGAPPLVCLHGLTRNSRDFEGFADYWSQYFRVLAIDLRGRGRSDYDPNWHNYHIGRYALDVWQWLDSLQIHRFIPVGSSMGGLVAMLLGFQKPPRIRAILINDIGPQLMREGIARILGYLEPQHVPVPFATAVKRVELLNRRFFPDFTAQEWHDFTAKLYRRVGAEGYVSAYDPNIIQALQNVELLDDDLWYLYTALKPIPMLAIRGASSDLLSPEILAKMQALKPDLEVAVIPDRGHHPFLDEAESIAAVRSFLINQALLDPND